MGFTAEQKFKDRIDFPTPYMRYIHGIANPDFTSTISVQIPAYCDPELLPTIQAFRTQAANPNRVHFAICYQDDDLETLKELERIPNCFVKHIPKDEAPGLCAARYECHLLMTDEDFTLHSDSHMRAAKYWDVALIEQWKMIGDEKAIVSAYPHDFSMYYERDINDDVFTDINSKGISIGVVKNIEPDGNIRFRGMRRPIEDKAFVRGMFISGGCVFGPSRLDRDVPSDPYSYFVADELSMNVRYYTHGYKIYHPKFMPIWHLYSRTAVIKDKKIERFNTKDVNYDHRKIDERQRMKTLYGLLDMGVDLGEFGNGNEATVADFEKDSGINFRFHAVRKFGTTGHFFEDSLGDEEMKWICYDTKNETHVCKELPDIPSLIHEYEDRTICVQIPAYKDTSLKTTIKSMLYQADRQNRVHFAICLQDDVNNDAEILRQIPNVKVVVLTKDEMKGTGLARKKCQSLYDGEDYVLITDSHMLATWHWDTMLIDQLEKLDNEKAVISGYPCDYGICRGKPLWDGTFDVPGEVIPFGIGGFMESWNSTPNLLYGNKYSVNWVNDRYQSSEEYDTCGRNPGVSAAYLFSHGRFNADIGFSESAMYRGDECMTSLVLYTKGYDVYTYKLGYLRHDGIGGRARAKYTSHANEIRNMQHEQKEFYDLVITGKCSDLELGHDRTIDDFCKDMGVNFKKAAVYVRAFMEEPGKSTVNKESMGNKQERLDDKNRRTAKIHVFGIFGKNTKTSVESFEKNLKDAAYRPENIVLVPVIIDDDRPCGTHFNTVFNAKKLPVSDFMLIVDEGTRFVLGWDQDFLKCMTKAGEHFVFSTATNLTEDEVVTAYVNPALQVSYDACASAISWSYASGNGRYVRPLICDGVVGMRVADYKKVRFAGDMSYADYMTTYSIRLYTHGYDVRYQPFSYLYRQYCPDEIDDKPQVNQDLVDYLFENPDKALSEDWKTYKFGNGKVRSAYDWFTELGFVDLFHATKKTIVI